MKFAIVPACLRDATCAQAYAVGSTVKVLETGRIDWRPLEELILRFAEELVAATRAALDFVSELSSSQ